MRDMPPQNRARRRRSRRRPSRRGQGPGDTRSSRARKPRARCPGCRDGGAGRSHRRSYPGRAWSSHARYSPWPAGWAGRRAWAPRPRRTTFLQRALWISCPSWIGALGFLFSFQALLLHVGRRPRDGIAGSRGDNHAKINKKCPHRKIFAIKKVRPAPRNGNRPLGIGWI